jgi:hypothetical protein
MPVALGIIGAVAGVIGAGVSIAGAVSSSSLQQQQLNLEREQYANSLGSQIRDIDKEISALEGQNIQYGIDIQEAQSQVDSYDKWLANYGSQYAQEVQSRQAQTDQLMASGKETYENFLNAIGYADAMAGATGRVGAGTSQAHTTGMLDRKLVDYVGEDRTLDASGGLFGSQLTAANMEMEQLRVGLDFQRQEMEANRELAQSSIAGWQQAIGLTNESITRSREARDGLQGDYNKFIESFVNGTPPSAAGESGSATNERGGRRRRDDLYDL